MLGVQILLTLEKAKQTLKALQSVEPLENKELDAAIDYLATELMAAIEDTEDNE